MMMLAVVVAVEVSSCILQTKHKPRYDLSKTV